MGKSSPESSLQRVAEGVSAAGGPEERTSRSSRPKADMPVDSDAGGALQPQGIKSGLPIDIS